MSNPVFHWPLITDIPALNLQTHDMQGWNLQGTRAATGALSKVLYLAPVDLGSQIPHQLVSQGDIPQR